MNTFVLQFLRRRDLRHDDPLRVAGAAAINAVDGLGRWNEGRDGVHVGRESKLRLGLLRTGRPNVEAVAFDGHALDPVAKLRQLAGQCLAHRGFHASGRFDVN